MAWKFIAREAMMRRMHWDIWLEEDRREEPRQGTFPWILGGGSTPRAAACSEGKKVQEGT
jgi:hypothetical protein